MKKYKVYYKEQIGAFVFITLISVVLFFMMWYGYNPATCTQNIAYLAVFMWVVCTGYLLSHTKFKKN